MGRGARVSGRRFRAERERQVVAEDDLDMEPPEEGGAAAAGPGADYHTTPEPEPAAQAPTGGEPGDSSDVPDETDAPEQVPETTETPTRGRLLIYEAQLNLAVRDVVAKVDEVVEISNDVGGFVLNQDNNSVVIRVPVGRFREVLGRIEAIGDVLNRRVTAQDVSEQMRDMRIRLRNAVQMRERFAVLLARAQTVPESLAIEREIERLTETIELIRGQLADLQGRISFSTITVQFQPIREESQVPRERFRLPFPWLEQLGLPNLMRLPTQRRR